MTFNLAPKKKPTGISAITDYLTEFGFCYVVNVTWTILASFTLLINIELFPFMMCMSHTNTNWYQLSPGSKSLVPLSVALLFHAVAL